MTCREKLEKEHPECVGDAFWGGKGCPSDYGYLPKSEEYYGAFGCASIEHCRACWNREIQEEKVEAIPYEPEPHIKDSGDRTEFSTGAVRDMHGGKGRCDLMPLDVVGYILDSPTICYISSYQKTGETKDLINALTSSGVYHDAKTMFLEVAKHFEEGAKKYGENNWQKGIPVNCYIDSAVRHYLKWLRGDQDERHDRAFCWNILCCIWTCEHMPELNPYKKNEEKTE